MPSIEAVGASQRTPRSTELRDFLFIELNALMLNNPQQFYVQLAWVRLSVVR